ncbi:MAG: Single-stranded-DNA-specific exonuclease RecJ [Synergistales bacterium 53_16]|nr:MAG: Single-stranded-DNA-specific exonuclease RecJ [Synergistales bacterium 53_16]
MKTKVVGVTKDNKDGRNRQDILREMQQRGCVGEKLFLEHEENNPYDPNAISILNKEGQQIGYLKKDYSEDVAKMLKKGLDVYAVVTEITGGTNSKKSLGCNIELPMLQMSEEDEDLDDKRSSSSGCMSVILLAIFIFFILYLIF